MENKQFTQEELSQIKELQDKYNALGLQLVQLKLARKNAEIYLKQLQEQEEVLDSQIQETNTKEKELAVSFDTKYGAGSLDLETGVFTPKTE